MPDEKSNDKPRTDTDRQSFPPSPVDISIEQRIVAPESKNFGRSEQTEPDDPFAAIKKGELALIVINGLLLVVTIVIACIYNGQLNQMRKATDAATKASKTAEDTLTEMRTGSGAGDTHTLAQQAVTQANELRDSIRQSSRLAQAAEQANANAVQGERPWVGLSGPIVLSEVTQGPQQMIEVTAKVKNFGKSPAFNVVPVLDFVIGDRGTDIRPAIEKACAEVERNILPRKVGEVLFPGDDFSFPTETYNTLNGRNSDPLYFFPGCIIYIDRDNHVRHTKICQWTDREHLKNGAALSSCSRQSAD